MHLKVIAWYCLVAILIGKAIMISSLLNDECKTVKLNMRMLSDVISTPLVYTALQCYDKCLRIISCDGINFKQRNSNQMYSTCQLIQLNHHANLSAENGFMFITINRTLTRTNWLMPSCNAINPNQICERAIDACAHVPYQCKKGFLDDGKGTCSLTGCTENAYFAAQNGEIRTPSYMEDECSMKRYLLYASYSCYYVISLDKEENITIEFTKLELKGSDHIPCQDAIQFIEIIANDVNSANTMRVCGHHGSSSIKRDIFARKIYIKFHSNIHQNTCISFIAGYKLTRKN